MSNRWSRIGLGALCLGLVCSSLRAEDTAKASAPIKDPAVLAALIDHYIDEGYVAKKATPAPIADDAEFLRRVYLDLAGRIPRNSEARRFLDDKSPDKRARVIGELLESPQYVGNMTRVYRTMLMPPGNDPQVQALAPAMEAWLRKHFVRNTPYDEMVRDLLTAPVTGQPAMQQPGGPNQPGDATAFVFYQANQLKPENLAAATSRLFLGVSIQCAQCHDHKFAKWTRVQFWEYAAFFSGIGPQAAPQPDSDPDFTQATDAAHRHSITMPGKDKVIQARFLDGKQPDWKNEDVTTRAALAKWMTAPDNPFFARAAVNRIWSQMFGIGIVDPPDDIRDENPASHPELLDALAKAFVDNQYDLKFLLKAIALSKTYQRTSAVDGATDDPRLFTHMAVKGLTAEQLYDSLALATGFSDGGDATGPVNPFGGGGARDEFITRFTNSADRRTELQTSILQALQLMNGKISGDATSLIMSKKNNTLAAATDSPFLDTRAKLDLLYLSALGRRMRPNEVERMMKYVEKGGPSGDQNKALADVFWALINSSEFMFNH